MSPWRVTVTHIGPLIVVRRFWVSTEDSFRLWPNGEWDHCCDHKGPWVRISRTVVPEYVRDRARAAVA
jgi:hypothetical protein